MQPRVILQRHRAALLVFCVAVVWFVPGVWWGLPQPGTAVPRPWGPDELAPWGVQAFLDAMRGVPSGMSPQYPLFHYMILGPLAWAYRLAVLAADNVGLPAQQASIRFLTLLERLPSVAMAAGAVTAAWSAVLRLTGSRRGAIVAAAAMATTGPLVFYARTSNVDAPALFWLALSLVPAAAALRDGLTARRAMLCGVCAGLGTATKDPQYSVFAGLGAALLVSHLIDARLSHARVQWRAPAAGLAAAALCWTLASGVLLMPSWFASHVDFILHGGNVEAPPEIRRLAGFYGSNPATPAGYDAVGFETLMQLGAALGPLLLAVAAAGVLAAARSGRRSLLLLLPPLALLAGVILPVRFVLPRFLLPAELFACVFAGVGMAASWRSRTAVRAAALAAVLALAWSAARSLDLTWQMVRDGRYEAGEWLARNALPGDTLGYYGARLKLPAVPGQVELGLAPFQLRLREEPLLEAPQLIVVAPQQMHEVDREWVLPDSSFQKLLDGSAGYTEVLAVQTPALWTRPLRVASFVNPPVRVFARADVAERLRGAERIELPRPPARR